MRESHRDDSIEVKCLTTLTEDESIAIGALPATAVRPQDIAVPSPELHAGGRVRATFRCRTGAAAQRRLSRPCGSGDAGAGARSHGWLFALADGVGGHATGRSGLAHRGRELCCAGFREAAARTSRSPRLLQRLVQRANASRVRGRTGVGTHGAGMATTLVACALALRSRGGRARGRFALLSDPPRERLPCSRAITPWPTSMPGWACCPQEEAAEAETRHMLSRSLGGDLFVGVEIERPPGVRRRCAAAVLGRAARFGQRRRNCRNRGRTGRICERAARRLVELANERDGSDNVSAQLIRVRSVERVGMYRGRPYKLR